MSTTNETTETTETNEYVDELIKNLNAKWGTKYTTANEFANYTPTYTAGGKYKDETHMLEDWTNDLNTLQNKAYLDTEKSNAINAAGTIKQDALDFAKDTEATKLQYADTRRQLMAKYMPETLLAQGVANTGYTADALLKAENLYNQYAHNAMSERSATEQSALSEYNLAEQNALADYSKAYNQLMMDKNSNALKVFKEAAERELAEQNRQQTEESTKEAENTLVKQTAQEVYNTLIANGYDPKDDAEYMYNQIISTAALHTKDQDVLNEIAAWAAGAVGLAKYQVPLVNGGTQDQPQDQPQDGTQGTQEGQNTTQGTQEGQDQPQDQPQDQNVDLSISTTGITLSSKSIKKHAFDGNEGDVFRVLYDGTYYKVEAGSPIPSDSANKTLKAIYNALSEKNKNGAYIYGDNSIVEVNDKLYLVTTKDGVRKIFPLETKGWGWGKNLSKLEAAANIK